MEAGVLKTFNIFDTHVSGENFCFRISIHRLFSLHLHKTQIEKNSKKSNWAPIQGSGAGHFKMISSAT